MKNLARLLLFSALLAGCAAPQSSGSPSTNSGTDQPAANPKVITVSALTPIRTFGAWDTSNAGGTFALSDIHTSSLITNDNQGKPEGRLLSKLPSVDDGTMVILPDGRMQTTWTLRPGIKWHDGTPMTAEDLAFTFQAYRQQDIGLAISGVVDNILTIEARDAQTAVATWKSSYYQPYRLGLREFWPLPKHLLGRALETDRANFPNLPYWTSEYVNSGPFRVTDFGLGDQVVYERFNDYFLGVPKVSTIIFKVFTDTNVLFLNLRTGTIDISSDGSIERDVALKLDIEWKASGEGRVVFSPGSLRFHVVQFDPQLARPPELAKDVRLREGLVMAVDRQALSEALLPGVPNTTANSYLPDSDPRTPEVGKIYSRYAYDPRAAAQRLAAGGWNRAADGRLMNQAGEQVELEVRSPAAQKNEGSIWAQYWRDLGIQANEVNISGALSSDREYNATFPTFNITANGSREGVVSRLLSTAHAGPQNRYAGANTGHYTNLELDRLFATLSSTPDPKVQIPLIKQMGEILATDLPLLPSYFTVSLAAQRAGVRALENDLGWADSPGSVAHNAHLWDRD